MFTDKRLEEWFKSLPQDKMIAVGLECLTELLIIQSIYIPAGTNVPCWEQSGERLDEIEIENEN